MYAPRGIFESNAPDDKSIIHFLFTLRVTLTLQRCRIYSGFHFLLAHYVPPFEHVKDKM